MQRSLFKNSATIFGLVFFIVAILFVLLLPYVFMSATIVVVFVAYGIRMVWKYGRLWWVKHNSKVAQRERFLLFLASLMVLFLAVGTALHLCAFYFEYQDGIIKHENYLFVNAEYLLRSLICSFQLFTGSIDSNVLDTISDHYYLKGLISIQALLSLLCTVAVLLSLAYARVKAYYKLHRKTKIDIDHNHLYVFFGINEPSRLLAKSIKNKEGERSVVIFVEHKEANLDDQNGWESIVGMFTHRRQTFADADELDARVTFTETRLCNIDKNQFDNNNILEDINLRKLRYLIQQLTTVSDAELHIFFLSEKEDENIRALSVLALDSTIHQVNESVNLRFYCHARKNGLNRIVEDIAVKHGIEVSIIDSSFLAVELLKADEINHPVHLVELDGDNPTTVKSSFDSLIVGFDEVGRDALKFLYEFGAFVDYRSKADNVMRSPFHCIVVDKNMDDLKGRFETFSPAVLKQRNIDGSKLVELKTCDIQSGEFFDDIIGLSLRQELNYVVIAIGDDEMGMSIAIRILNHIRRYREDLSKLRIYVRSYHSDKESFFKQIADFYNEGYNTDSDKRFTTDAIIIPFGQKERIYSYDMIIGEDLTKRGKKFQERYAQAKGDDLWDTRRLLLTGTARVKGKDKDKKKILEIIPVDKRKASFKDLQSLRRKESQDLANALHADTKMYLLRNSLSNDFDWNSFYARYFKSDGVTAYCEGHHDSIKYPLLSNQENSIILNLARLEHLRWNASHEMLGYVKAHIGLHSCDERTREHNCLRPWQELDKESMDVKDSEGWECDYKLFDFAVVDNTILLDKEKSLVPM